MSIINDALKKARKEFEIKKITTDVTGIPEREPSPAIEYSDVKWTIGAIVCLVIIVSLLGSIILYSSISKSKVRHTRAPVRAVESQNSPPLRRTVNAKPSADTKLPDALELNGIVYGPKDKWAIINNKIVREGDAVLNGRLSFIAKDFVKIKNDAGEDIVLELR